VFTPPRKGKLPVLALLVAEATEEELALVEEATEEELEELEVT
jgi:hypothetical protein